MIENEFDLIESTISGNNIIEASAGTGKTYSIEGLYIRILLLPHLEENRQQKDLTGVENILVVTYTEAATAELRLRILEKIKMSLKGFQITKMVLSEQGSSNDKQLKLSLEALKDDFVEKLIFSTLPQIEKKGLELLDLVINQLKASLLSFDEAAIHTIHGFCKRMLSDFSLESQSSFDFDFTTNQQYIIDECVNDYWRNKVYQSDQQYAELFLSFFKTPSKITPYFSLVINKPYTLLEPSGTALPNDWFQNLKKQYQSLRAIWLDKRDEIESLIKDNEKNLKKNYVKWIPSMFDEMEQYFSVGSPSEVSATLKNYTPKIIGKETRIRIDPITHVFFDEFEPFFGIMSTLKANMVAEFIPQLLRNFQKKKEAMNILSFDDLLMNLNIALKREGGDKLENKIRKRFHVALIDEFQDTDPIQYEIFYRLFYNQIPLFLIGDPKQSIYNFRGADIFAYFKAVTDSDIKSQLKTNWRSCKDLVTAFNTIFLGLGNNEQFVFEDKIQYSASEGSPSQPDRSLIIDEEEPEPFQFWFLKNDASAESGPIRQRMLEATVTEIVKLLNLGVHKRARIKTEGTEKPVEPMDIAILVSSHAQAEAFQEALRSKNVPSVLRGTRNIFETQEFYEIKLLLKGIHEYYSESSLKPVFVTELFDYNGEELLLLFENEELWEERIDQFQGLNHIWQNKGLFSMIQYFMESENIREKFLSFEGGERKLSNLIQISEILQRTQLENQLDSQGLIQWIEMIEQNPDEYEDNVIRLETDDEALSILTVHSSKGLQFPIVFCPYSWSTGKQTSDVIFHDPKNEDRLTLDLLKQSDHKEIANKEKLAEQIRLAYVAFTRAKCCCYIAWAKINSTNRSCYTHLFHRGFMNNDAKFKDITIDEYWKDLEDLQERSNATIAVSDLPDESAEVFQPAPTKERDLISQQLDEKLFSNTSIYSFTGLMKKETFFQSEPDIEKDDEEDAEPRRTPVFDALIPNLRDFPGGINTGNFFHDILEHVDFQVAEPPSELVTTKLKQYGFSNDWGPTVLELIERIRTLSIRSDYTKDGSFSFSEIPPKKVVKEMSFYFALNQVKLSKAIEIVQSHKSTPFRSALLKSLESIDFEQLNGFMKGFIDMVFCYGNRYYILDWKTNNLGSGVEDYSAERMEFKINDYNYNLQYTIYTIALHKYLKTRIPDYKFEIHFGGVYYLFLRGVQKESVNDGAGVYYESLADCKEIIEGLGSLFQGGSHV